MASIFIHSFASGGGRAATWFSVPSNPKPPPKPPPSKGKTLSWTPREVQLTRCPFSAYADSWRLCQE